MKPFNNSLWKSHWFLIYNVSWSHESNIIKLLNTLFCILIYIFLIIFITSYAIGITNKDFFLKKKKNITSTVYHTKLCWYNVPWISRKLTVNVHTDVYAPLNILINIKPNKYISNKYSPHEQAAVPLFQLEAWVWQEPLGQLSLPLWAELSHGKLRHVGIEHDLVPEKLKVQ